MPFTYKSFKFHILNATSVSISPDGHHVVSLVPQRREVPRFVIIG
jgi:hypothetical protein